MKRMITVKAKKQSELASKRRHRSGLSINGAQKPNAGEAAGEVMSMDSASQSPEGNVPLSPKSSPIPMYSLPYPQNGPKPFQHGRSVVPTLSPSPTQANVTDISDIFTAQTRRTKTPFELRLL